MRTRPLKRTLRKPATSNPLTLKPQMTVSPSLFHHLHTQHRRRLGRFPTRGSQEPDADAAGVGGQVVWAVPEGLLVGLDDRRVAVDQDADGDLAAVAFGAGRRLGAGLVGLLLGVLAKDDLLARAA